MERVGYCFRMVFWIGYVPTQVLDSLLIQEEVQGISQFSVLLVVTRYVILCSLPRNYCLSGFVARPRL